MQCAHIINRCESLKELTAALYSRLQHLEQLTPLTLRFVQALSRPYLTVWHSLPDLPDPALVRTLSGHMDLVAGCAISPDGSFIVSASRDNTLKVWDATGDCLATLRTDSPRRACACFPDTEHIIAAGNAGLYFLRLVR
jgi:WD40 repeat protein